MLDVFTALSKYLFILLACFVCISAYSERALLRPKRMKGKIGKGTLQKIAVLLFVVLSNTVLFANRKDFVFILMLFMELFYFFFIMNIFPMLYTKCNQIIINDMCFLMCVGICILSRLNTDKAIRQFLMIVIGTVFLFLIPVIVKKIKFLKSLGIVYAITGIGLLLVVFILGKTVYGANLSINIFGISMQPSEIVKLTFVMFTGSMFYKGITKRKVIVATFVALIHIGILVLSNDLGTALIFSVTYVVMLFDVTKKYRVLGIAGGLGSIFAVAAYFLVSHVKVRFDVWQDPFKYIDGTGYQMVQSLYAIGTGSLFGTGLTKGLPGSIPVVTKDFVFSAISEEFGALFCIVLIFIMLELFYEIITVSSQSKDLFNRIILGGFGITFILQCFINIGGVIKLIPSTGVTLPFISYGGSSIISLMLMIALTEGIATINNTFIYDEEGNLITEELKYRTSKRMLLGGFLLAISLVIYFTWLVFTFDNSLLASSYNKRGSKLAASVIRGNIYSSDGQLLAGNGTKVSNDNTVSDIRIYPYGNIFSHVIGHTKGEMAGLEGALNMHLLNSNSGIKDYIVRDITGQKPVGNDIYTTLNSTLQVAAYNALGSFDGAVVVMDTKGSILAMVSKPDYNPDNLAVEESKKNNAPYLNRAINGLYPPASTFKTITLLEFYRECMEGVIDDSFADYVYDCSGVFVLDDMSVYCVRHEPHGSVDTYDSMAHSCNGSFINIGLKLKLELWHETCEKLLFNKPLYFYDYFGNDITESSFTLDNESSIFSVMQTSFGQGETLISPIHNALIMQSIANDGVMYVPYIVDEIKSSVGKSLYSYEDSQTEKIMADTMDLKEAVMLKEHLKAVVIDGFPHVFGNAPYTCAGKSGTAQYGTEGNEHSLFVGFMPFENPEIVVSIILENFNANENANKYAVDVAKEIFDTYYDLIMKKN